MSLINLFFQDNINRKLNYIETKLFEQILPSDLSTSSKEVIAVLLRRNPKISGKIADLEGKINNQINIGAVMFINALIGLIPIPIIPGLLRDFNNIIFQILQTTDTIYELKSIIDTSLELLEYDPTIRTFLENKGIDMEKINPNIEENAIIENIADSAKKAFQEIDIEYLQGNKLTTLEIYNRINDLANKRIEIQNTKSSLVLPSSKSATKPIALSTPKNTAKSLALPSQKSLKITQKAGKKIKNKKQKKQKKYYKKITRRNKHKNIIKKITRRNKDKK